MQLQELREQVLCANLDLVRHGLVMSTFGNASGFDRDQQIVVIKPSGVPYERLTPKDMVLTTIDGDVVEASLRPSSDLQTHLALYRAFSQIAGIVHTHSRYATAWAQAHREINCLGTTHADYFNGPLPLTRLMRPSEIERDYEWNTGQVIVERFADLNPLAIPGVLVAGHAPFCWGASVCEAVHIATIIEEVAHLAFLTMNINALVPSLSGTLLDKHFSRKHGAAAYYGQPS